MSFSVHVLSVYLLCSRIFLDGGKWTLPPVMFRTNKIKQYVQKQIIKMWYYLVPECLYSYVEGRDTGDTVQMFSGIPRYESFCIYAVFYV